MRTSTTYFKTKTVPVTLKFFFMCSQLCFGYNFGFTTMFKPKYHWFVKNFTILISLIWSLFYFIILIYFYDDSWIWLNSCKYYISLIVLYKLKYTVYDLYIDINDITEIHGRDRKYLAVISICYWVVLDIIVKSVFVGMRCSSEINTYCGKFNLTVYVFWCLGVISLDCFGVTQTLIFFCIKCCLKNIRGNINENVGEMKLTKFEKEYRTLTECYGKIRPLLDAMIILQLGITVPKMLATFWSIMWYMKANQIYSIITEGWFAVHLFIQVCTPAIVAETINQEVDSIKQILKEKLLEDLDERELSDIRHALQLIDTRPLNYFVLRFIPVDLRLLLALFTVCSNYFIVIIQFTHLYE